MTFETLLVERDGMLVTVTLNRPKQLNAINRTMVRELDDLAAGLETDAAARVVIFTGAGDRAFLAGADVGEFQGLSPIEALGLSQRFQRLYSRIEALPQVTIAAVNGFALGGGCELTQCCDLVVAAETARFGQPEINLGIIPGFGGTQRLPRLVGEGKALEMNLTGDAISAAEAHRVGLVHTVVPDHELFDTALGWGRKLAGQAPLAIEQRPDVVDIRQHLRRDLGQLTHQRIPADLGLAETAAQLLLGQLPDGL